MNFQTNPNAYYACNPSLVQHCGVQFVQHVVPIAVQPMQAFCLNKIPFASPQYQPQTQFASSQYQPQTQFVTPSHSPQYCYTYQSPVQMEQLNLTPPRMVLEDWSQSPPRIVLEDYSQSSTTGHATSSVGGAGSQSSEVTPVLGEFYSFDIAKQKVSSEEMMNQYGQELVKAMRNTLKLPNIHFSIHIISSKTPKNFTIQWITNQETCDYTILKQRTMRPNFQMKLICELAKIDRFNKHLCGAKQLTIINGGWECLSVLKDYLISKNGTLHQLLAVQEEDRFREEVVEILFKVSEDVRGQALRGSTVVGIRFKQQSDIIKMSSFVERVKHQVGIQRATMIASLKTHKQYKGWSVYLDVGNVENVKRVEEISQKFGFEKAKAFVAEDTFQRG